MLGHVQLGRHLSDGMLYDCAQCEQQPAMKQLLGHDGTPTGFYRENLVSGASLAECPLRTVLRARERDAIALELDEYRSTHWPLYKIGHLLVAGGTSDQPARYLDWMLMLDAHDQHVQGAYTKNLERQRGLDSEG